MASRTQELNRLLALYRKGIIDEETLVEQIRQIDAEAELRPETAGLGDAEVRALVEVLDGYRAAEESGAATLGTWAEQSTDQALVGGLRTAAAREAKHALLLEQRVRELGGEPEASIPEWLAEFNARLTSEQTTDLERLEMIVARFPDIEASVAPLSEVIGVLADEDPLTAELLRTICVDEVSTLEWAHDAYADRRSEVPDLEPETDPA